MTSPVRFIARHKGAVSSDCTVPVLMRIAQREPNSLLVSPRARERAGESKRLYQVYERLPRPECEREKQAQAAWYNQ